MTNILETVNVIFISIFAIEMLIKIAAFGPYGYIKDAYNLFDGVIVIVRYEIFIITVNKLAWKIFYVDIWITFLGVKLFFKTKFTGEKIFNPAIC